MNLSIYLLKKLKSVTAHIKTKAIARQERELEDAAERVDLAYECSDKRIELAETIYNQLVERASDKCQQDIEDANNMKASASVNLAELSLL